MTSQYLKLVKTGDGSLTLYNTVIEEHYHSIFGAITESEHVFIRSGFDIAAKSARGDLSILEIGFGTGLSALLTLLRAREMKINVKYIGIDPAPVPEEILAEIDFEGIPRSGAGSDIFLSLHRSPAGQWSPHEQYFDLYKITEAYPCIVPSKDIDLVYFDAFSPEKQPELWDQEVFRSIHEVMVPGGLLLTYSSKGSVKRNLRAAGFTVKRLEGPPGKRHIVRAQRISKES